MRCYVNYIPCRPLFVCSLCNNYSATSYGRILTHIEDIHQYSAGFVLTCHFCPETFTKMSSYKYPIQLTKLFINFVHCCRSHLYRKHRDSVHRNEQTDDTIQEIATRAYEQPTEDTPQDNSTDNSYSDTNTEIIHSTSPQDKKRQEALFILKAKEERKLTQTALNGLLPDISCMSTLFSMYGDVHAYCTMSSINRKRENNCYSNHKK